MMPYRSDEEHDDESELDHLRPTLVASSPELHRLPPPVRSQAAIPPLYLGRPSRLLNHSRLLRRCDTCVLISGCLPLPVIGHMDHLVVSPGTLHRRMVKRTYVPLATRVVPSNGANGGSSPQKG